MNNLSICIPTYKRLDYLKSLVENIPSEYQVCISDNGNYIPNNFFNRPNVKVKHLQSVVPMFSNWNNAIEMVETEWFIIPGDDDIVLPDKLSLIENLTEEFSDCAYIAFAYDIIDENGKIIGGWYPSKTTKYTEKEGLMSIIRNVPFRWPALVINTHKSRNIGNFDESFSFTAGDSLYLQTLAAKYPIAIVNEIAGQYRVWGNGFTNQRICTKEWFDLIDLWQQKLSIIIEKEAIIVNCNKVHDLAIFDNLITALSVNKNSTLKDRCNFVKVIGWPKSIGIGNHLRLLKYILVV